MRGEGRNTCGEYSYAYKLSMVHLKQCGKASLWLHNDSLDNLTMVSDLI